MFKSRNGACTETPLRVCLGLPCPSCPRLSQVPSVVGCWVPLLRPQGPQQKEVPCTGTPGQSAGMAAVLAAGRRFRKSRERNMNKNTRVTHDPDLEIMSSVGLGFPPSEWEGQEPHPGWSGPLQGKAPIPKSWSLQCNAKNRTQRGFCNRASWPQEDAPDPGPRDPVSLKWLFWELRGVRDFPLLRPLSSGESGDGVWEASLPRTP